jgi:imidazoleglycerol-phosphate dehydratase
MLDQIARHGLIDLEITADGDLHIDGHHTVEDVGITLGQAVAQAVGDKKGITRYGHSYVPLDEAPRAWWSISPAARAWRWT